jgi:hypothetical protein
MAEVGAGHSRFTTRLSDAIKTPRVRRFGLWFAVFFAFVGLFGYFAAPPLLKSVLLKQLSAELQREVSIERIDINPYALSAKISGLSVTAAGGKEVFGFDELFLNVSSASLFQLGLVVDEIRLSGPRVAVARLAEGQYDISDLLEKWLQPSEPSPTLRFSLNNIQLQNGQIAFDDQPAGKQHVISAIKLNVPFVSSLPYQADITVEPHFSAVLAGSPLVLEGKSKPFSQNRESFLNLDIEHFDLGAFKAYVPAALPFRLQSATVDSSLQLVFKELPGQLFSLSLAGKAQLSGLTVQDSHAQSLIGWKKLDVELDDTDLINQRFGIQKVALDGLDVTLAVNKQGEMNWLQIAEQLSAKSATEPSANSATAPAKKPLATASTAPAPSWSLNAFELSNARVRWQDDSNVKPVRGELRNIQAKLGKIDSQWAAPLLLNDVSWQMDLGERFRVEQFHLSEVKVDLASHRVDIAALDNNKTQIRLLRNKEGQIEWLNPPVLKTVKAVREEKKDTQPWQINFTKLAVNDLMFRLEDQTASPAAVQLIDGFNLLAEGLSTEPGKKGKLTLQTRINQKGQLNVDGSLQLLPLAFNVKVETQAIPLLPLQPYFTDMLNISLTRGQISSHGEVQAEQGKDGLNALYKGSLTLGDLLTVDKINNADLLKWKSLYVGGIDFRLQPMAVNIAEVALTDFYSRVIVGPTGELNLANIVKKPVADAGKEVKPAVAALPASDVAGKDKPAMPIKITKVTLQGGTVNFSDFFVKPNYTANLTQVGGRVTGLSSAADTVAEMELRGRYAESAPVSVQARLNPFAAKTFLDLKAEVNGVDLVAMSPYAGKYAGYNIDKGKLSLNVSYQLENGQLTADNRLFIDQLTFGDKVDSPTATSLPVNLAISLLKNNRGEIDLNLPISGSLDDPQFSIGGLVVKVIVNLFVKAVTSPFALLGSMFGGGEELSNIEFAAGRASFNEPANKKLEALAKALRDRDSLKLEITGRADPESDKEGLKWAAIDRAVRTEKQQELIKKGVESNSLETLELSEAEYPVYLQRAYKEAKFPKPRNMVGMQKDLPREEMEKLMLTYLPATPDDVRQLAVRRAEKVQAWLIEQGKVPSGRIFLLPPKVAVDEKLKASRVDFSLR